MVFRYCWKVVDLKYKCLNTGYLDVDLRLCNESVIAPVLLLWACARFLCDTVISAMHLEKKIHIKEANN